MSKNKALKSNLEQSVLEIKKLSEVLQVLEAKNGESSKSSAALITHNSSVISQLEAQLKSMTE